ncbi:EthD domain-containing protein [Zhongshania aliphaticivorans]|uniref:EthD domain-containing protein n=1 Tax=Zhongshania aliphaticivorans TaxID=1470434 RepID=UPI0012E67099|nr:EthD domain-containing protein [Zhongshania aliphaticivorans]CAA0080753.1 Uncharacterised protein [Zhongshania aliphaticivorans]
MRKIIYLMWSDSSDEHFMRALHQELIPRLGDIAGIVRRQLNIPDHDVDAASALRMENSAAAFDAMCSVWCTNEVAAALLDNIVRNFCVQFSRYHVEEIERLPNTLHSSECGVRTFGFSQVALLRCPQRMEYDAWLAYWQNTHTTIALETQSTFRYVQNIVSEVAGEDVSCYHAIVEECFPALAMTDSAVFYNAAGDSKKQQDNMKRMIDSCVNFIDFDEIDVVPTSEYVY